MSIIEKVEKYLDRGPNSQEAILLVLSRSDWMSKEEILLEAKKRGFKRVRRLTLQHHLHHLIYNGFVEFKRVPFWGDDDINALVPKYLYKKTGKGRIFKSSEPDTIGPPILIGQGAKGNRN